MVTSLAATFLLFLPAAATTLFAATTVWNFDGNLDAESGYAKMRYRDVRTQASSSFGTTDGSTIPNLEGKAVKYLSFPVSNDYTGFCVDRPLDSPLLRAYTLAWDLLVPDDSFESPKYKCMGLFNSNLAGTDDAELFVDLRKGKAGQLFADRDTDDAKVSTSPGVIRPNQWHRIVWVYDENHPTEDIRIFVDGVKVGASDASFGSPAFTLPDHFPVFQDGGGKVPDHAPGLVASMALVERAMTDAEVIALGKPKSRGFASIADPGTAPQPPKPVPVKGFNMVFFPDTQNETEFLPTMFQSQIDWILKNRVNQKIAYVGHLGDITNHGNEPEYKTAHKIMFQLNRAEGLTWGTSAGNHDIGTPQKDAGYEKYFGPRNFEGKKWYGDSTCKLSSYQIFHAEGRDYLVLCLQYAADATVLDWAQKVLDTHPNMPTIINTHMYFKPNGTYEPYAKMLWDRLIDKNSQIFLVMCGHHWTQGPIYASRTNAKGKVVHEMMTDYQKANHGGGHLRLLNFDEESSAIHVTTYSPYFEHYHQVFKYDRFDIPLNFKTRLGPAVK